MSAEWNGNALLIEPPKKIMTPMVLPVKTLTGPGPSNCSKRVLHALQHQVIGHLHPEICELMDEVKEGLRYAFQTKNRLTLALSTSGHGGMEACLGNLLEPGETVLIAKAGLWGERAADMSDRFGARVAFLETEGYRAFTLEELRVGLEKYKPAAVFVVQAESSTGLKQSLIGVGDLVHKHNALLIVDTVASLGGEPFFMDAWGVDAVYTASQKCLGAPPGLTPVSLSPRAEEKLFSRKTRIPSFYMDFTILGDYWACFGKPRVYHHTLSATLLYGLREALSQLCEEGLSATWARHKAAAAKFRKGLELQGLQCYVKIPEYQLSTINTIVIPPGIDGKLISQRAMEKYKVEISGGLGPTVGKILRIGLMGTNATLHHVDLVLTALSEGLRYAVEAKL